MAEIRKLGAITKLNVVKQEPGAPVESIVKAARELLRDAKSGEVRGVLIITVTTEDDGALSTGLDRQWAGIDEYHALRTGLSNTFVRMAMDVIDMTAPPLITPELTEEDE